MPEPFEFTRHLHEIVGPALSALGFKRKNAKFIRSSGDATQYVYFQRDRYNDLYRSEMRPCGFYLNLNCGRTDSEYNLTGLRLINPTARRRPLRWFLLTEEQRKEQWPLLSDVLKEDLLAVQRSKDWWYSSEEELSRLFDTARGEIISKGLPYLEAVASSVGSPDFKARLQEAARAATMSYNHPDESVTAFNPGTSILTTQIRPEPWYLRLLRRQRKAD